MGNVPQTELNHVETTARFGGTGTGGDAESLTLLDGSVVPSWFSPSGTGSGTVWIHTFHSSAANEICRHAILWMQRSP